MAKCVVIEQADDGSVMVGEVPPGQYGDSLQPAGSLDEALEAARGLLSGPTEAPEGMMSGGRPQPSAENEQAFARGFEGPERY